MPGNRWIWRAIAAVTVAVRESPPSWVSST